MFPESSSSAFWFQPVWGLVLAVSMWSPSATWAGVLVSAAQLKDTCQIVLYIPWGATRTLFDHSTIVKANITFLVSLLFFCFCMPSLP